MKKTEDSVDSPILDLLRILAANEARRLIHEAIKPFNKPIHQVFCDDIEVMEAKKYGKKTSQ